MLEHNWHSLGAPATEREAEALDQIRRLLPDDARCHAWSNLEFMDSTGRGSEVDLLLLTPRGLYLIELKGWHGRISGRINNWTLRDGRGVQQVPNPINLTNTKAKRLKGLLTHEMEASADRGRLRLPYIEPVVVIHGRGARVDLSDSTTGAVHGLDGFDVAGVPSFSELLKGASRRGDFDKVQVNALVRLLVNCGLVPPRAPRPEPSPPAVHVATAAANTAVNPQPAASAERNEQAWPNLPVEAVGHPIFDGVTDLDLRELGVDEDLLGTVRAVTSVESLIGELPDDLWDDLEAVAGGEPIDEVVERRRAARDRLAEVDGLAGAVGWTPSPADVSPDDKGDDRHGPTTDTVDESSPPLHSELVRRLQDFFGESVTVRAPRPRPAVPLTHRLRPALAVPSPARVSVPAEALLGIARTEAMAGRLDAASRLHDLVRARLDSEYLLDWSLDDVVDLSRTLERDRHVSRRLAQMVADLRDGIPRAPQITGRPTTTVGSLWDGEDLGPAYSLLVRVPDVLDRRSGLFLSQLIGGEAAANVNARLRIGRPDGGRIRIAQDGTVVSRRDAESPWFVVGHVEANEWYPPERLLTV